MCGQRFPAVFCAHTGTRHQYTHNQHHHRHSGQPEDHIQRAFFLLISVGGNVARYILFLVQARCLFPAGPGPLPAVPVSLPGELLEQQGGGVEGLRRIGGILQTGGGVILRPLRQLLPGCRRFRRRLRVGEQGGIAQTVPAPVVPAGAADHVLHFLPAFRTKHCKSSRIAADRPGRSLFLLPVWHRAAFLSIGAAIPYREAKIRKEGPAVLSDPPDA